MTILGAVMKEPPFGLTKVISGSLDFLLDTQRIASKPRSGGSSRSTIWRSYLRLAACSEGPGEVRLLDYRVRYLDRGNLAHMFRELFIHRLYDVPLARQTPTIIDCGSNIGLSILFFKNLYPRATVIGFEPSPLTYPLLRQNVERNGLRDVVLHQVAVASHAGSLEFYVNREEPGALNAGFYGTHRNNTVVAVEASRLSDYVDGEIDLLKMDIEGAEEMALRDLAERGVLRRVRKIVCEYHHHHHRDSNADRLSITLAILEQAGFGYHIDAYYPRSRPQWTYQDVLVYAYRKDGGTDGS